VSRTRFLVAFLVATLLVAGVASYYASGSPDGLEYVAESTGFIGSAEEPLNADSPFADYGTSGVDDERLSVGIAGVLGVLIVLALMSAIAFAVRRREPVPAED
jgi:cobalt/nickel transport protein